VLGDQELAGSAASEQLNSHKHRSNHDSMNAVDSHSVDRMEIRQRLSGRAAEGNVSADLTYCATRFDPSHDISSRQVLVLKTYVRLRENP
jgi:hypothetical protein